MIVALALTATLSAPPSSDPTIAVGFARVTGIAPEGLTMLRNQVAIGLDEHRVRSTMLDAHVSSECIEKVACINRTLDAAGAHAMIVVSVLRVGAVLRTQLAMYRRGRTQPLHEDSYTTAGSQPTKTPKLAESLEWAVSVLRAEFTGIPGDAAVGEATTGEAATGEAATGEAATATDPDPSQASAPTTDQPKPARSIAPLLLAATSAVLATTGGVLIGLSQADAATVEKVRPGDGVAWLDVKDANDRVPILSGMGITLLATGLAGAGGAILWWVLGESPKAVSVVVTPNGFAVGGRF